MQQEIYFLAIDYLLGSSPRMFLVYGFTTYGT